MAETALPAELHKLSRNGQRSPRRDEREVPRAPRGLARARANTDVSAKSLTPGRTVERVADRWQFTGTDTLKRPLGREADTITALRMLRDLDPQASHAVWNYLRMINPGHTLRAYQFKTNEESPETHKESDMDTSSEIREEGAAQAFLDQVARRIGGEYGGGLDQLHNVLALGLITTGAVCAEVAPTADLDDVVDWYPVDPTLIAFLRDKEGTLHLGQRFRDGTFHDLNPNQVFYTPLDPDVDDPYGRPPLLPALSAVLAKGQMINDLRAVAHNQGYPRLDVSLKWDAIMAAAPPSLREPGREAEFKDWTENVLSAIVTDYESLQVDDTFVHYDWVDIKMVGGSAGVGAFDFAALEKILSRSVNSALKTLPILLGINETTSETHGSIQWQIQVQGVSALQRLIKRTIEKLADASLAIKGLPAHAKVEYQRIRTVDRLFEAQADFFETRTIQLQEMMGWRAHDEAAEMVTGHDAAGPIIDTKTPQPNLSTNTGGDTTQNLNTGANPDAAETAPTPVKTDPSWVSWKLLLDGEVSADPSGVASANSRWQALRETRARRALPHLTIEKSNDLVEKYVFRTRDIFHAAYFDCVRLLAEEGYDFQSQSISAGDEWTFRVGQDVAKDVSDYVFGVGYSREMKALLRDAFEEGMRAAGLDLDNVEFQIDERLIERVWKTNRQFVLKLRDELKRSLRDQEFHGLSDIKDWFDSRSWREDLMGRFLAKQGISAGFAYGVSVAIDNVAFTWVAMGGDSCPTCLSRDGHSFTYDEMTSIGFPGAIELECGSNCRCSLDPE